MLHFGTRLWVQDSVNSVRWETWAEGIEMTRVLSLLAVVGVAWALFCQTADAGPLRRNQTDPRLAATSFGVGVAGTVGFFALRNWQLHNKGRLNGLGINGAAITTTGACLALSPIVGTLMVQRELTFREAYALAADCIVPFVGGWLVNQAFDAHPEWEPRKARRKR
jgi:hypothetical protein